jgi:truncated hemoglobin YjbI
MTKQEKFQKLCEILVANEGYTNKYEREMLPHYLGAFSAIITEEQLDYWIPVLEEKDE